MGWIKWSQEEINILIEDFGTKDINTIRKKLKCRTVSAINTKAKTLGLCNDSGEYFTPKQVQEMFGYKSKSTVSNWINKYRLKVKRINIYTQNGGKKKILIDVYDLLKWLEKNQDKYTTINLEQYALGIEPNWLKEKRKCDYLKLLKTGRREFRWSKQDEEKLLRLYRDGKTMEEIGKLLGRSGQSCSKKLFRIFKRGDKQ